jgi:hypothetical protein
MAVQANLLGSSDLSRLVAAAQANRPPSLGQLAEARRKERMDTRTKLAELGLEYSLKKRDIENRFALGEQELEAKQQHYANEFSYREGLLKIEQQKANTQKEKLELDNLMTATKNFADSITQKDPNTGITTLLDEKEAKKLYDIFFKPFKNRSFESDFGSLYSLDKPETAAEIRKRIEEEKRKTELELQKEVDARSPDKAGGKKIVQTTGADKRFLSTGKPAFNPFIPTEAARRRVYTNNSNL